MHSGGNHAILIGKGFGKICRKKDEIDMKKHLIPLLLALAVCAGLLGVPNFCPNCGRKLDPDAKFCSNCGKSLIK